MINKGDVFMSQPLLEKCPRMSEILGMAAALLSSALGGTSIAATRYIAGAIDPAGLGAFRFGIGFVLLLPMAILRRERWPSKGDWIGVASLGVLFFGLFPLLFNASLEFTTAARAALALSTLPLLTMLAGAVLKIEPLSIRKTIGVLVATLGVAIALLSGLSSAPAGAWRGDLLMVAAALCMAFYNVWSRPFISRSGTLPFITIGMGVGAFILIGLSISRGSFVPVEAFNTSQWIAIAFLGVFGSAVTFFLWAFALGHTTPTRVAISITVNPIAASIVSALTLDEPVHLTILFGLLTVFIGILFAATETRS